MVSKKSAGITLVELLVVLLIITILATAFLMNYLAQIRKANDGRRRRDLYELQRAMEDYYNDHGCYPHGDDLLKLQHCRTNDFRPWLNKVPCDPANNKPYAILVEANDCPSWFAIYADMAYPRPNEACSQGCLVNGQNYSYAVSSPNITPPAQLGEAPTNTPSPTLPAGCAPATCGDADNRFCIPNICSTCCPGVEYRCNGAGTLCCYDASCR